MVSSEDIFLKYFFVYGHRFTETSASPGVSVSGIQFAPIGIYVGVRVRDPIYAYINLLPVTMITAGYSRHSRVSESVTGSG